MEKYKILVVEDEWNMRNLIKIYLSSNEEYEIEEAAEGLEALEKIKEEFFDLIILDIMLPVIDGWEVCKRIREFSKVPILMLTARADINDRVRGLKMGADDYLVKPFAPEELSARVMALLRRVKIIKNVISKEEQINIKDLNILPDSREVKIDKVSVDLTPKEYELLLLLARHPRGVFTREHLLNVIWGIDEDRDLRTVDTHVKNVREKLKRAKLSFNPIKTVWGVGYRFGETDV